MGLDFFISVCIRPGYMCRHCVLSAASQPSQLAILFSLQSVLGGGN